MDSNQKINCSVESCIYQDSEKMKCTLKAINVVPVTDCCSGDIDESMCGSYKCGEQ